MMMVMVVVLEALCIPAQANFVIFGFLNPITIGIFGVFTTCFINGQFAATNANINTQTICIHCVNKLVAKTFLFIITHQATTHNRNMIRFVINVFGLIKALLKFCQFNCQFICAITAQTGIIGFAMITTMTNQLPTQFTIQFARIAINNTIITITIQLNNNAAFCMFTCQICCCFCNNRIIFHLHNNLTIKTGFTTIGGRGNGNRTPAIHILIMQNFTICETAGAADRCGR